jgi:hypothetical protein
MRKGLRNLEKDKYVHLFQYQTEITYQQPDLALEPFCVKDAGWKEKSYPKDG